MMLRHLTRYAADRLSPAPPLSHTVKDLRVQLLWR
jgi:hypothetical protein